MPYFMHGFLCVCFVYCSNDYTILLSMECCGDVFLFVHPCLSFKLLPLHLLNIFFLFFSFFVQIAETTNSIYWCVCVCAMHLRSGHIHMQLIHYASSIATEWLLWRFFVCSFFFKNRTGGCRSDLFVCFAFFFAAALLFKFKSQSLHLFLSHSNGRLVSMFVVCFMHIYFIVYLAKDLTLIRT